MWNVDDISADLPAPSDDEPPSLRTDIIDELTDHLQSAFHRELHTGTTDLDPEPAARQRVLRRFGNPSTIARRLWYDAMQERIMNQRLTIAVLVVLVLMSGGMFVISWQSLGANREMVRESHELNRELIGELRNLAAASAAPSAPVQPAEWNRLIVRCVLDSESGPPAEGVRVLLDGESENTKGIPQSVEFTGDDGEIDFGLVLYGVYELRVTATTSETHERSVSVRPGMDKTVTIVCPSQRPAETTASFQIALPESVPISDELRDRLWLLCDLQQSGRDIAGSNWQPALRRHFKTCLVRVRDGMVLEVVPRDLGREMELVTGEATGSLSCEAGAYHLNGAGLLVERNQEPQGDDGHVTGDYGGRIRLIGESNERRFVAAVDAPNVFTIEVDPDGLGDELEEFISTD